MGLFRFLAVCLLVGSLFTSCGTQKKLTQAEICAECIEKYPPKVQVETDTFWEVKNFPIEEFVYIYEDTIECTYIDLYGEEKKGEGAVKKEIVIPVEKKDSVKVITRTKVVTDSAVVARNRELSFIVSQLEEQLDQCDPGVKSKWWIILIAAMALTILVMAFKK